MTYHQTPSQPKKPSKITMGCGGCAIVFIGLIAVGAVADSTQNSSPSTVSQPATSTTTQSAAPATKTAPTQQADTITYIVTGTSMADVQYGPSGSSLQGSVPLHVTKPLGNPSYYSITAQLQGGGSVSCALEVDGKIISQSTATGGYNIASCEISQDPFSGKWTDTNSS